MSNQQFGNYRVIKELGGGGFGVVYLAEDVLGERVAIKMFRLRDQTVAGQITSASQDAGSVLQQRFMDEARILWRLSTNPHIVDMYHFDRLDDGTPYYVMPFLEKSLVDEMGKDAFSLGALEDLAP